MKKICVTCGKRIWWWQMACIRLSRDEPHAHLDCWWKLHKAKVEQMDREQADRHQIELMKIAIKELEQEKS